LDGVCYIVIKLTKDDLYGSLLNLLKRFPIDLGRLGRQTRLACSRAVFYKQVISACSWSCDD